MEAHRQGEYISARQASSLQTAPTKCKSVYAQIYMIVCAKRLVSFVYAGYGNIPGSGAGSIQFDTINILTLPAFHWIKVPYNPENPRFGLTCEHVGGSQILTIGGIDSNIPIGANLPTSTIIEASFSSPDPFAQGLNIFDMTSLTFQNQYTAGAPPYEQPDVLKQFYSQSAQ